MWDIIKNLTLAAFAIWGVYKMDPQRMDQCYLQTIDYVADFFHAVAPSPPPMTSPV